jgi:hypothetical protein
MTASMTKTEEKRLNKFVWASDVQPENGENTAIKTENPFRSRDRHDKKIRTTRTEGLIGAKNNRNMQEEAIYLGNVGKSAAIAYTLIETCKLNRVNPEAWLAWVLECIQDHPANRIGELMRLAYQAMVEEQKAELEAKTPLDQMQR